MRILCPRRGRSRQVRSLSLGSAIFLASPFVACGVALADPTLPTIGSTVYNLTVSNSNIDNGVTIGTGASASTNAAVINAAITYASANGGGTVEIPSSAGAYLTTAITLKSNVNLQVDTGATLQNSATTSTFITTSGTTHDIEISGGGILDNHATTTSSNNMISLQHITNLWVRNVTIENASHEHLVPEADTNVTLDNVNINDAYTLSKKGGVYLSNTDGIDYSGSNFLIENCNVSDGDDNIVAKPGSTACSNITIKNCTIGAGHGISVGGQTNLGLNGMTVTNCTFNGTQNGFRLKAGTPNGGVVQNVSFSNCTMTNVIQPIIINSWYNGQDHYGSQELTPSAYNEVSNPGDPTLTVDQTNNTAAYPFFDNISYSNITDNVTGGGDPCVLIYGLNSIPANATNQPARNIDTVTFSNVNILNAAYGADIYYVSNLNISGLNITAQNGNSEYLYGDSLVAVPEPASGVLALGALAGMALRRPRKRRSQAGPPPPA